MSKALIVGAAGFVGSYLARELKDHHGMEVHATKLAHEQLEIPGVAIHDLNILNKDEIVALLYEVRPDYIFHLAAQSSVSVAWKNPGLTIDINVKGSVNLMDAVRELFYKPRVLLIGSGEEYGHIREGETPIKEDNYLRPGNIYAATKVCQNMVGSIYINICFFRFFLLLLPSLPFAGSSGHSTTSVPASRRSLSSRISANR